MSGWLSRPMGSVAPGVRVQIDGVLISSTALSDRGRVDIAVRVLLTVVVCLWAGGTAWFDYPWHAVAAALSAGSMTAVGAKLEIADRFRVSGRLLTANGVLVATSWLYLRGHGPFPLLGECTNTLSNLVLAGAIMVHIAGGRVTRDIVPWLIFSSGVFAVSQATVIISTDTGGRGYGPDVLWPHVDLGEWALDAIRWSGMLGYCLLVFTSLLLIRRIRHPLTQAGRAATRPWLVIWVTCCFSALALETQVVDSAYAFSSWVWVRSLQGCILLMVPLVLLVESSWTLWQTILMSWRLSREGPLVTPQRLESVLRRMLHDDLFRMRLWSAEGQEYRAASGEDSDRGWSAGEGRAVVEIATVQRGQVAQWEVDALQANSPRRLESAAVASAATMLSLRAQMDALESARLLQERLLVAEHQARAGIVRDLHDGVQQLLLSLTFELSRGLRQDDPTAKDRTLDECLARTHQITDEIRRMARGIQSPTLRELGVAAAVEEMAERAQRVIHSDIPERRFDEGTEALLYFIFAEALTNAQKHTTYGDIRATLIVDDEHARVTVRDEGPGGAVLTPGGGLSGLLDRVTAMRGVFHLDSPPGGGTTLVATVPYER